MLALEARLVELSALFLALTFVRSFNLFYELLRFGFLSFVLKFPYLSGHEYVSKRSWLRCFPPSRIFSLPLPKLPQISRIRKLKLDCIKMTSEYV